MTTPTTIMDDTETNIHERPGAQLAAARNSKGYSIEYIANKLHLRTRVIELLEADDYSQMPTPVFVKGYLRAYAKLVDMDADLLMDIFNHNYSDELKSEKAPLWQSRRDTSRGERAIRWLTTLFGIAVLISVVFWWQKNKENQHLFEHTTAEVKKKESSDYAQADIRLTDLSTMRSLLSSENQYNTVESKGE